MDFGKKNPLQSRYSTFVRFWRKQGNLELTRITFVWNLKLLRIASTKRLIAAVKEIKIPDNIFSLISLTLSETKIAVKVQNDLSDSLEIKNGVQKGDALACLLFNLALEKVVSDSNINTRGNIFNKPIELLAFADDIDIIARTLTSLRQAFLSLEKEALRIGVKINENKTKYMPCTKSCFNNSHFKIEEYSVEVVDSFTYLGS
ncbi:putative endonuclease-reverse transcriptase [Trichonephila clavipes]|nr:putative endonuclease-reverse transcriptase [Trichonephila clavipes]